MTKRSQERKTKILHVRDAYSVNSPEATRRKSVITRNFLVPIETSRKQPFHSSELML